MEPWRHPLGRQPSYCNYVFRRAVGTFADPGKPRQARDRGAQRPSPISNRLGLNTLVNRSGEQLEFHYRIKLEEMGNGQAS